MKRLLVVLAALAMVLAACGGGTDDAGDSGGSDGGSALTGDATAGADVFNSTCAACHGPDGKGIEGLGKDFTTSDFLDSQSDDEMVAFLKVGRPSSDPANDTGVDMPPKGGNPSLTDQDLYDVTAYLRTLD